ncbi:hypothetical protein AB0C70_39575 [Streptomyces sp. NPDC048564]|uniref:hypothetical protein n=1 Tax=Streptomyces sp. NPDC048564 TaxID=3155760 RepID=UPI00342F7F80
MAGTVDVQAPREGVQKHALLEIVREWDRQVAIIGLLQSESVVAHIRVDMVLPDKHGHKKPSSSQTTSHRRDRKRPFHRRAAETEEPSQSVWLCSACQCSRLIRRRNIGLRAVARALQEMVLDRNGDCVVGVDAERVPMFIAHGRWVAEAASPDSMGRLSISTSA